MRFIYCQLFTAPRELHATQNESGTSQVHGRWCTVFIKNVPPPEGTCWSKIVFPIEEADDTNITLQLAALKQLQQKIRETDFLWQNKVSFHLTFTVPPQLMSHSISEFLSEHRKLMMVASSPPASCNMSILSIHSQTWEGQQLVFML